MLYRLTAEGQRFAGLALWCCVAPEQAWIGLFAGETAAGPGWKAFARLGSVARGIDFAGPRDAVQ